MQLQFTEVQGSTMKGWRVGCQNPLTQIWIWRDLPGKRRPHGRVVALARLEMLRAFTAEAQQRAAQFANIARELRDLEKSVGV